MIKNFIFVKNESIDPVKWQKLIANSPFVSPFQIPQFYNFCNQTQGHQGFVGAVAGNKGELFALCVADIIKGKGIKSFFTRRAIIYGGPVLSDDNQESALKVLLENLHLELKKKVIYIEIRNLYDYSLFNSVYTENSWKYVPYQNVRNDLRNKSLNDLITGFKYNRRREIKLSLKAGLSYQETENEKDIKDIYTILKEIYTKRVGVPLPPLQYFIDFSKTGLLKVFKVIDQQVIVGGSFCIVMKSEAIYTFYYCGKRDYRPRVYPTHLAILAAMKYGIENGLKIIDFMGAGRPEAEYGVRKYKLEFGGKLVEEGRYIRLENKTLFYLGFFVINFWKIILSNLTR